MADSVHLPAIDPMSTYDENLDEIAESVVELRRKVECLRDPERARLLTFIDVVLMELGMCIARRSNGASDDATRRSISTAQARSRDGGSEPGDGSRRPFTSGR